MGGGLADRGGLARHTRVSGPSLRPRRTFGAGTGDIRCVRKLRGVRAALLSDIHGNAVAFRAALADVERHDVDLIVSLGDVAQRGPQPKECVDLLRELDCPCVSGNSDEFLLTLDDPVPLLPWSEYAIVSDELEVWFRRIPFNVGKLIDAASAAHFPHFERWAAMWQR